MPAKEQPNVAKDRPVVEEITIETAKRILDQKGFKRLIQVSRDPRTGHIIDLVLREMA